MNIAVFASHAGSDLQAIIDGCKNNQSNANVLVVISNNGDSLQHCFPNLVEKICMA